jgi:hypothetical protein
VRLFSEILLVGIAIGTSISNTYNLDSIVANLMIRVVFDDDKINNCGYFLADKTIAGLSHQWMDPANTQSEGKVLSFFASLFLKLNMITFMSFPIISLLVVFGLGFQSIFRNGVFSAPALVSALSMFIAGTSFLLLFTALFVRLRLIQQERWTE